MFEIGDLCISELVNQLSQVDHNFKIFLQVSVGRYVHGDWGDILDSTKSINEENAMYGIGRIFAKYNDVRGRSICIISNLDNHETNIVFADEY